MKTISPSLRLATAADQEALYDFIFAHGQNPWNYLPEAGVREHLAGIATGTIQALIIEIDGTLAGFATFHPSTHLARYRKTEQATKPHGYIAEVVVHRGQAGKGLGTILLQAAVTQLRAQGYDEIFVERHEENPGSAGMMRKAGFTVIDIFDDPERRMSGSRRTAVCRLQKAG